MCLKTATLKPFLKGLAFNLKEMVQSRVKINTMQRYYVKTFGCQMNKHDSERMAGLLETLGFTPALTEQEADIILINTCAVRENAVRRLKGYIRSLGKPKRRGALIGVAGCVAQIEREKLLSEIPFIDFVFGPDEIDLLPELIADAQKGNRRAAAEFKPEFFASSLPAKRETGHHAWLAITKGCDNYCSYCVVPYARGTLVSRPFEEVLGEAERLKAEGISDITLLGQNVNAYGRDIYGQPRFVELLEATAGLGFRRVSFATSHPADFQPELVNLISKFKNISRQLHLPVQSGSDRILARMKRRYTRGDYLKIVKLIREIPDISLTTDIIVGFPGETEADFEQTLDLIEKAEFDHVFTFIFSPRPFAEASSYPDQVPDEVKKERFNRLVQIVKEVSLRRNRRLIGSNVEAVVEGASRTRGYIQARTEGGKVILFRGRDIVPGQTVRLVVKDAGPYHLVGDILSGQQTAV